MRVRLRHPVVAAAVLLAFARPALAQLMTSFHGHADAAQVVPPSASPGSGYARIDQFNGAIVLFVSFSGFTGNCTFVHVHGPAAPGATGATVQTLTCPNATAGNTFFPLTLSEENVADLQHGLLYVDFHSTGLPGGEIRAQIRPTSGFIGRFTAAAETAGSTSSGRGMAFATIDSVTGTAWFSTSIQGVGAFTAMELRGPALPRADGALIQNYGGSGGDSVFVGGALSDPTHVNELKLARLYFDVKTAAFPSGDVRAQIHRANAPNDYDGDGRAEFALQRGSTGIWYLQNPGSAAFTAIPWGLGTDQYTPGDYDGDGAFDAAVFRSGTFYIRGSYDGAMRSFAFGLSTDQTKLAGDYDGDGRADVVVYRPSTSVFYILQSLDGGFRAVPWGVTNDATVLGDFDGDMKSDVAIYRPSSNTFYVLQSATGTLKAFPFGVWSTDILTPGDYDGDGKTDFAVYRNSGPGAGTWYIWQSATNTLRAEAWGLPDDVPVPADYDGDGKADLAVVRTSGGTYQWYVKRSSDGALAAGGFGTGGDRIVASFMIR